MIRPLDAPSDVDGLDELLLAQRQDLAADDARDVGPVREHDDRRARPAGRAAARRPGSPPWSSTRTRGRGRAAAPGTRAGCRSCGRSACPPSRGRSRRSCPSVTPIITDRPVPMNATISDTWAPLSTREKTSRPISSTPKRCSLDGPVGRPKMSSASVDVAFGSGAPTRFRIGVARIAITISSKMKIPAASDTLSLRKRRQKSCSGDRAATGALPATISSTPWSSACSRSLAPVPVLKSVAPSGWFGLP